VSFFSRILNLGRGKWSSVTREREVLTEEGWKQELEGVAPAAAAPSQVAAAPASAPATEPTPPDTAAAPEETGSEPVKKTL